MHIESSFSEGMVSDHWLYKLYKLENDILTAGRLLNNLAT